MVSTRSMTVALHAVSVVLVPLWATVLIYFVFRVDSVGLAPIERWRIILRRARKHGSFVGGDERRFPRVLAVFVRYHTDLKGCPHAILCQDDCQSAG